MIDPLLALLAGSPAAFVALMAALGLMAGSFLNVVIHRLPLMIERQWREECAALGSGAEPAPAPPLNLMVPRSRCPQCAAPVRALDNIPVLSWLLLRGRCRACRAAIPLRYPLVEAAAGVLAALAAWRFGFGPAAPLAAVLCCALLALAVIDLDTQLLPDAITLPLMWLGIAVSYVGVFTDLESSVLGAMAGYLSLWSVYWLFKLVRGKEGMGYGDFKLLAAIGAWLGWQALAAVIVLASVVGAAAGLLLIAFRGHDRSVPIPFGPYLAAAGALALFLGPDFVAGSWLGHGGGL